MKKRILSLLLAAVLLCALLPVSPAQAAKVTAFRDVDNGAWFAPYVYALVEKGIVNGMSPTTFQPQSSLTRAQLMKMLAAFAADEATLKTYAGKNLFPDVKSGAWYETYVNWAAEKEITSGYNDGTFGPNRNVTRAEAATLAARFAEKSGKGKLSPTGEKKPFADDKAIPAWAKESVYLCRQAGVISGYNDGTFQGGRTMTRAEAAKVLCVLFGVTPMAQKDLPVSPSAGVKSISGTYAGYGVTGVSFDPRAYKAGIVLAQNRFFATESVPSMVSRSGAVVACNGAFFNNASDLTTWSAFIRNGKALRIDNAHAGNKCYFVVDSQGRASMQFLSINQEAVLLRGNEELDRFDNVGCNFALGEGDSTRMVFTHEYGSQVPVKMKCAVWCDENGVVTKTLDAKTAQTITIPEKGFVLCAAFRRDESSPYTWDTLYSDAKPGDTVRLDLSYGGSSVQDIEMAFCCGPTVVKNGKVYGNTTTYAAEGYTEGRVISGASKRMCIGVKADGTVVMASANCDLQGLGKIMQALGCQTAMNLDGGASAALYVGGSARVTEGRALSHLIVFTAR